jgi:hypothetical protein
VSLGVWVEIRSIREPEARAETVGTRQKGSDCVREVDAKSQVGFTAEAVDRDNSHHGWNVPIWARPVIRARLAIALHRGFRRL